MAANLRVLPWLYRSKLNEKEKAPIYLRIAKGKQRVEIATGYFINLSEWNTRTHTVKSTSSQAKEINDHLKTQRAKCPNPRFSWTVLLKWFSKFCSFSMVGISFFGFILTRAHNWSSRKLRSILRFFVIFCCRCINLQ